jgi:hypothetical protein
MNEQYVPRPTSPGNSSLLAGLFALLLLLVLIAGGVLVGIRYFTAQVRNEQLRALEAEQRARVELIRAQQAMEKYERLKDEESGEKSSAENQ